MKTQQDHNVRVVALVNLEAMCENASGICHRFWIDKVSRSRVHVAYSNPDEYGTESPMVAIFPCYPSGWDGDEDHNPRVVLDIMRVIGDTWDGEGWQAFEPIVSGPKMYRAGLDGAAWHVHVQSGG